MRLPGFFLENSISLSPILLIGKDCSLVGSLRSLAKTLCPLPGDNTPLNGANPSPSEKAIPITGNLYLPVGTLRSITLFTIYQFF